MKVKKKEKSSSVQLKKRNLQPKENRRSSGSQQKLGGVTYESYNGFENISANNTKIFLFRQVSQKKDIKISKAALFDF